MKHSAIIACALLVACSGSAPTQSADSTEDGATIDIGAPEPDVLTSDSPVDVADEGAADLQPHDSSPADISPDTASKGLPFSFTRPQAGAPVTAAELTAITDKYIDLLAKTRYFDLLEERIHGWPQSDPQQRYWYGTWWSAVSISKIGGQVTYVHLAGGGDNNGLRTGPLLEGACFAQHLWNTPKLQQIVRTMIRGFNSWILAMQRQPNDPAGTLLTRSSFPASITSTDYGRTVLFDYSLNHPGTDSSACEFVHNPNNPHWGDIWVKNKRSKDCIGHMLRAIASLDDCSFTFDPATQKDLAEMLANYTSWSKKVEADNWSIATYDKDLNVWFPPDALAHFYGIANTECDAMVAVRLNGHGDPGNFDCGNGIHPAELLILQNDHNGEIVRSFHEAAIKHALRANHFPMALNLLGGLALRLDEGMQYAATKWPVHMEERNLFDLLVHAANTGVPLTHKEVRWLHAQIEKAHAAFVTNTDPASYDVFSPSTPDGSYFFIPTGAAIHFRSLALAIGTCVASFRNPASSPLLDCAHLKQSWAP